MFAVRDPFDFAKILLAASPTYIPSQSSGMGELAGIAYNLPVAVDGKPITEVRSGSYRCRRP